MPLRPNRPPRRPAPPGTRKRWTGSIWSGWPQRVGTPCHVYSARAIRARLDALVTAHEGLDAHIHYAVKANDNLAILKVMHDAGVGADIVSLGELQRCLHVGMPASRIVFSGVGKQRDEILAALDAGIARFNVESRDELDLLQTLAAESGVTARAAVRINPDVDARTHAKISTGRAENKFGVDTAEARRWFAEADSRPAVRLDGLHVHIGSQMTELAPLGEALKRVAAFATELAGAGHAIASIDVGGGLGVNYRPDRDAAPEAVEYAALIREALEDFRGRILLEPGRWLMAEAGLLLTRVIRVKPGRTRRFVIVDAAMNDMMRPALYDAWHDIRPVLAEEREMHACDIVGPVCETGDTFATGRMLPACKPGELLMISATGAYGASMASNYNARPRAAEVLVDDGRFAVIRRRQRFEDMIAGEQPTPTWEMA